jgi:hypothetical protein
MLSPVLYNDIAGMLSTLIGREKEDGQIGGLIPHLVDGGVSILQYEDDTLLFTEHDLHKVVSINLTLSMFELLSGLKINFHKSEIFSFGKVSEEVHQYRQMFQCESGSLPYRYFGVIIHYKNHRNLEWSLVESRLKGKLG